MSDRTKNLRNVAIILALALIVWGVPGGAESERTLSNLLSVIFLGGLAFFAYRMYMENRTTLMDLTDRNRILLYGSTALVVFTLIATSRMWNESGAFILLWFALLGLAAYGFTTVVRAWREY